MAVDPIARSLAGAALAKGGGESTGNYNELTNKPEIGGVVLIGDKTPEQLGLASKDAVQGKIGRHDYETHLEFPVVPEEEWRADFFVATKENEIYRWDDTDKKYFCIGSDYNSIQIINGGNAFTK